MACISGGPVRGIHKDAAHTRGAAGAVGAVPGSDTGHGNLLGDSQHNALPKLDLLEGEAG